jgi:hypothetical protein
MKLSLYSKLTEIDQNTPKKYPQIIPKWYPQIKKGDL